VPETQETNNVKYNVAMKVGPDLIESSVVVPAAGGAGAVLVVSDTVKNQGSGTAGPSTTTFYLSSNATLDTGDQLLGTRVVPSLAASATSAASTSLTIPDGTTTGTYYILVKADANNEVAESAETNNLSYGTTKVGPDLTIASLTASVTTAAAGATISVTDTTKNAGAGAAPDSATRYYLSTNITFDASDVPLGGRAAGALAAGVSSTATMSVVIPSTTTAGSYYIIAVADADGVVTETAETNNTRALFIKITVGG
jgi:subtilase family serine protease